MRHLLPGQMGIITGIPSSSMHHNPLQWKASFYRKAHPTFFDQCKKKCKPKEPDDEYIVLETQRAKLQPSADDFLKQFPFPGSIHHSPAEILAVQLLVPFLGDW
eukprot:TRINITY_DN9652_c0_g2_i1.p3 TRINITY_DN9652_c0_g2~~TRINITY_DN9652_c0_g2_i1.p3  ORF type:complete len:104 (-),score=9.55 TRINITY_DN9652_c0_g2_i1:376-687(-)